MEIVFLDRGTLGPRVSLRSIEVPHTFKEYAQTRPDEVLGRLQDATVAIVNKVNLPAEVLSGLPKLKLVAIAATGSDCVDKACCQAHGIAVCNIRGYAQRTVPEHTFALMLALRRAIVPFRQDTLAGHWQRAGQFCFFSHQILDLGGARLGLIGRGALGSRVAEIAQAFGMTAVFAGRKGEADPPPPYRPWDEVLETSDIISLHAPLTPQTRGLLGMAEFRTMKRRPLIINTARGGLVVEEDLERALDEGLVGGAGIDVTMPEPPAADGPLMRMAARPNVIVTPHVAWASDEAMQTLADQLVDNIENFLAGRPTNLVQASS